MAEEKEIENTSLNFAEVFACSIPSTFLAATVYPPFVAYATDTRAFSGYYINLARSIPTIGLNFALKHTIHTNVFGEMDKSDDQLFYKSFASGGIAGVLTNSLLYSGENARFRMKGDIMAEKLGGTRQFATFGDCWKKTLASEGYTGLYRGFLASSLGVFVFRGCFFGLYEGLKPMLFEDDELLAANLGLGYMTCMASDVIARPFFNVATQPLMSLQNPYAEPYKGALDCMLRMYKSGGFKVLFEGSSGSAVRGVFGAVCLAFYDYFKMKYFDYRSGREVVFFSLW